MLSPSSEYPSVLAVAGPTASGKTALAVELARAVDGEVVNADALQVYRELRVLTARPTRGERGEVPHHLFGHVAAGVRYSVGDWLRDAVPVLEDMRARGKRAVLVGGTGLYFQALFRGLAEVPEVPDDVRALVAGMEPDELEMHARALDPDAHSRLQGHDPQRLTRIVEVALGTGTPLSEWQGKTVPVIRDWAGVVVEPDREALYSRIDTRFDAMMEHGALDEAQKVSHLARDLPALKAIGVSHLLRHLDGELEREEAIELAKRDSRRLAKRQGTWFRGQAGDWPRVSMGADADDVLAAMCASTPA